jgi:LemA protein
MLGVTIGVIIALIIVLIIKLIRLNNQYIEAEEVVENANQSIEVQQMSRYDLLKHLMSRLNDFKEHEIAFLKQVVESRRGYSRTCENIEASDNALTAATKGLFALAEQYPDLKSDALYVKYMDSAEQYENNVRLARMIYNDTASKFNIFKRQFPNSLFLGVIGKDKSKTSLYQVSAGRSDYPEF